MDSRGGCCIARYGGHGYDMSKVYRIMLRFRPIAPKPATGDGGVSPAPSGNKGGDMQSKPQRGKKRHAKDYKNNTNKCSSKKRDVYSSEETPTLLPLLPLMPHEDAKTKELHREKLDLSQKKKQNGTVWLSFNNNNQAQGKMMHPMIRSRVIVECVTDAWVNSTALGCTDYEKRMHLEKDTCPGFISEGLSRVTWTNPAFKSMVSQGAEGDMMVSLVIMERVMPLVNIQCPAFTCRATLQYTCKKDKRSSLNSITLPCDVLRMNGGNFAWRLDVDAALCLGR